jgi:superfamily II DNA or RNA helicase
MPTGAGKTFVGTEAVHGAVAKGTPVLWLAHRRELVDQSCHALERAGLRCGAICATATYPARDAGVQVASVQSLLARELRPFAGRAPFLVWDECHHAAEAAEEWASLLEAYPDSRMLGLTATPERGDGAGLAPLFDQLVVGATIARLQRTTDPTTGRTVLVPCDVVRPDDRLRGGQIAQDPVDAYLQHARGQQGFLFTRTIDDAEGFVERLGERGVSARVVSSRTPAAQRRAAIEGFRAGEVRLLCNVYVFTEGTDLPAATVCILARGCGTAGQMLQMVGRVLRSAPGKARALLLDLAGVTHTHGEPDAERIWSLHGRACTTTGATICASCSAAIDEYPCPMCGFAPEGIDPVKTVVVDAPIKFAAKRAEGEDARWSTILRWAAVAAEKGYKPAWLSRKYAAVYGADPPKGWCFKAISLARGDRKVGVA